VKRLHGWVPAQAPEGLGEEWVVAWNLRAMRGNGV
jgi:hypothetical protein